MRAKVSSVRGPEVIHCPELLLTGLELELATHTPLCILHMKGRRFESPWAPFFVGIYAHSLFYFASLDDWPCGVVPLFDATVKPVDRLFRHGDGATGGDDCGPCWKLTSSSGRVLLFRASSHDARVTWIEQARQACVKAGGFRKSNMDGKAALALARRLSRTTSAASSVSSLLTVDVQSPRQLEQTEMLRDALQTVEKQRLEIEELRKLVHKCGENGMQTEEETREVHEHTGREEGTEIREKSGKDDMEQGVIKEGGGEDQSGKSNADEDVDFLAVLEGNSIEICKDSRASAISDVLSEDDDTLLTEEEDNVEEENDNEDVQTNGQGDGRNNILSLSLVDELREVSLSHEDDQVAKTNSDDEEVREVQLLSPCKNATVLALQSPEQEDASIMVASRQKPVRSNSHTSSLSAALIDCQNAAENESIQQQVAELVEMAHNLNKDDATDSSSAHGSSEDGLLTPNLEGSQNGASFFGSNAGAENDFLQQQAMELAEIARNLQSSFQADTMPSTVPLELTLSSSSLVGFQPSFSDVTDLDLNQINSNGSNDSIFSITQDDLYFDEDEDGEIERLSEFDASDNQFLEASGFLDSIHQVMKNFIVSTQADPSRQSDLLIIDDESTAAIAQETDTNSSKVVDSFKEAYRQRAFQTDLPIAESLSGTSPRIRAIFSPTRSAQDFLNEDIDCAPLSQSPKDLPSLVVEDTMSVVASILQSAGREDKMLLLSPFLRVFGSRNHLSHLIRWAIEIEVASVINVATLFRSDDYASRLVSTYSKAIGSKFIRVALSDPIRQTCKLKIADMELNPHKEESLKDEAQADLNAANLMRTCQNIIDSIIKNANYIPSSYFHICSHLNSKVISRFDGSKEGVEAEDASTLTRSVIGGFLFLRFVCPAITTPHLYGLTKQLPPPETRRVLVLVTKLLFKTATGVKFGDREPQFKVLNPFIEQNSPAIQQLFANLAMSPSQDIDECFASDSRKIYSHVSSSQLIEDVEVIRSISEKNLDDIEKKLAECECPLEVVESFKTAVLTSSDPQKSSLTKKLSANMKFLSGFGKKPRTRKQSDQ